MCKRNVPASTALIVQVPTSACTCVRALYTDFDILNSIDGIHSSNLERKHQGYVANLI